MPAGKSIYFRSDSVAYQAAVTSHYSQPGRRFSITTDQDVAVRRETPNLPETAWQPYRTEESFVTDREIAETVHSMSARLVPDLGLACCVWCGKSACRRRESAASWFNRNIT